MSENILDPLTLFKALADDTRLHCLLLIAAEDELCVCELIEALQQAQPKISRHLGQLRRLGLLLDRRQGQWVYYRLNPEMPEWAQSVISSTLTHAPASYSEAIQRLQEMGERPARSVNCCSE
ncbi:arsenical resistance operon repressor [Methylophaga lonarensis MPL]|uniref:Arsenical resistance operon repressor n=1 Tax=Methylophaga lonarensis MPL TaxID=1286106 RepID=M7P068_9GAMM|nr:metalloregulator ArsR/SmtB family transcription factor [Methylophaga lonarensis]EMR12856.1 arsenical resistance operon repressor [Methylophaga lonarensis MPL]